MAQVNPFTVHRHTVAKLPPEPKRSNISKSKQKKKKILVKIPIKTIKIFLPALAKSILLKMFVLALMVMDLPLTTSFAFKLTGALTFPMLGLLVNFCELLRINLGDDGLRGTLTRGGGGVVWLLLLLLEREERLGEEAEEEMGAETGMRSSKLYGTK